MKQDKIIYLIQGQAKLVETYMHLASRPNSDAIFLTYDQKLDGAIFFPNSTWSEGRNHMLSLAVKRNNYLYYIFCDDDISFKKGDWNIFEEELLFLKPSIGVPVVPKTSRSVIPFQRYQTFLQNDEQLIAFHKDVIIDRILFPYRSEFDKIHWWAACLIQQTLIQNFYHHTSLQFNRVRISNDCHARYFGGKDPDDDSFKVNVDEWLKEQFRGDFVKSSKVFYKKIPDFIRDTRCYTRKMMASGLQNYRLSPNEVSHHLKEQSILYGNWKAAED